MSSYIIIYSIGELSGLQKVQRIFHLSLDVLSYFFYEYPGGLGIYRLKILKNRKISFLLLFGPPPLNKIFSSAVEYQT